VDARRDVPELHLHDCQERKMNDDTVGRRNLRRMWSPRAGHGNRPVSRLGGLAVLAATAAIGLAACGGSSTPHVASLGQSSGSGGSTTTGNSTTALPKGNPTQLLNEWTACMRSHGDPDQANPVVDPGNAIHVTVPLQYFGTIYGASHNSATGAGVTCQAYLTAAAVTLNGGQPVPQPDLATVDKYAECMRANGVPDYPSPIPLPGGQAANPGNPFPNPNTPAFQKAVKVCQQKTGIVMPVLGGPTIPGEIEITDPNVPGPHDTTVYLGPPNG
jgi:hypothetical protein